MSFSIRFLQSMPVSIVVHFGNRGKASSTRVWYSPIDRKFYCPFVDPKVFFDTQDEAEKFAQDFLIKL